MNSSGCMDGSKENFQLWLKMRGCGRERDKKHCGRRCFGSDGSMVRTKDIKLMLEWNCEASGFNVEKGR
jgi:hypothetical protein